MNLSLLLGKLAAIAAALGLYRAATRGWLGWRLSSRALAIALGLTVVLFGAPITRYVISAVQSSGATTFVAVWAIALIAGVALIRSIRTRWPSIGMPIAGLILAALLIPEVASSALNIAIPFVAVGVVCWLFLRLLHVPN